MSNAPAPIDDLTPADLPDTDHPLPDPWTWWSQRQLEQRGIVTSGTDTWRKQRYPADPGDPFPPSHAFGANQRRFRAIDVIRWCLRREAATTRPPLKPEPPRSLPPSSGRPRGRPSKKANQRTFGRGLENDEAEKTEAASS